MKTFLKIFEFDKKKLDIYIILLSAPLLLSIYYYFGSAKFFVKTFSNLKHNPEFELYSYIYQFAVFFILMLIIPMLFIKFRLKRPLTDFGIGLGDKKFGIKAILILFPLFILPLVLSSYKMADVQQEYPMCKLLHSRRDLILIYELAYIFLYYIAWEFFFRGFLLFSLADEYGNLPAILIQTFSFCLIHIGKPAGETLGAIIAGILFGAIALRTRSIWFVLLLHACLGVLTDIFIIFFG